MAATASYYPASEYGRGSSCSVMGYPQSMTPQGSAVTSSRSSYAPVVLLLPHTLVLCVVAGSNPEPDISVRAAQYVGGGGQSVVRLLM